MLDTVTVKSTSSPIPGFEGDHEAIGTMSTLSTSLTVILPDIASELLSSLFSITLLSSSTTADITYSPASRFPAFNLIVVLSPGAKALNSAAQSFLSSL